jgi:hypothetical protein
MSLRRQRAALLTQVQQPHSQDHGPELGKNSASKANRQGGAERFPAPAGQKRLDVALALLGDYDRLLTALERGRGNTAKAHTAPVFSRLRALPGGGKLLALVLLDAIHDSQRVPRGQEVGSSCRLVTCATASAGTR